MEKFPKFAYEKIPFSFLASPQTPIYLHTLTCSSAMVFVRSTQLQHWYAWRGFHSLWSIDNDSVAYFTQLKEGFSLHPHWYKNRVGQPRAEGFIQPVFHSQLLFPHKVTTTPIFFGAY